MYGSEGQLRSKCEVELEISAILELMLEIDYEKIHKGVTYFKNHQENQKAKQQRFQKVLVLKMLCLIQVVKIMLIIEKRLKIS